MSTVVRRGRLAHRLGAVDRHGACVRALNTDALTDLECTGRVAEG
jgi:hypothetical protein